jgi:HemY protein
MRLLFLSLLTLAAAVALALFARQDPGYVLISHSNWSVETSLTLFLLLLIASLFLLDLALRTTLNTWHLPTRLHAWSKRRRTLRARRTTQRGLISLAEGHWARAEKELIRYADDSDTPLLNYLTAARAAQIQHADERRDLYLSRAHHSMPDAELAVGLTQADVQLSQGQLELALATLMHLRSVAPKHEHVLYLLKRLYEKLEEWDELLTLLPELRKRKIIESEAANNLERKIHLHRILRSARAGKLEALHKVWSEIPKALHHDPELVNCYVQQLSTLEQDVESEQLLCETLKQHWDNRLVRRYGQITTEQLSRQMGTAEGWLKQHPENPELLLALGRLSLQSQLWGKARAYLEASLGAERRAETYCELGNLLSRLGEERQAAEYYRQGLEMTVGQSCLDLKPRH